MFCIRIIHCKTNSKKLFCLTFIISFHLIETNKLKHSTFSKTLRYKWNLDIVREKERHRGDGKSWKPNWTNASLLHARDNKGSRTTRTHSYTIE